MQQLASELSATVSNIHDGGPSIATEQQEIMLSEEEEEDDDDDSDSARNNTNKYSNNLRSQNMG